ncbi:MAG TPA: DNA-formamidopyrimidine glycosylase family protein [Candidatus Desulfaltia sp.]|nr:DNA-formamidopyrimidine glycosylase family protein [Candidatus Desulfaltia sp.]
MSVELPEAHILAKQMREALRGRVVKSVTLSDYEKLQRIGFVNRNVEEFQWLVGRAVEDVVSRGNTVRVDLDEGVNLLIAPEYGGVVLLSEAGDEPEKSHLRIDFDGGVLTVRLTSMGLILAVRDRDLNASYIYRRDFLTGVSPLEDAFTSEWFSETVSRLNRGLKQVLVGKDAVLVGLSNSAFQDVIYRAGLHPKRKASSLSTAEAEGLFNAVKGIVEERLQFGGKDEFVDLHGKRGGYSPRMGPNMSGGVCLSCGSNIEGVKHGGGTVYLCPVCQV